MSQGTDISTAMEAARGGTALRILRGHLDTVAAPVRLYLDLGFDAYVELTDPIAWQPLGGPIDPVLVWVRRDLQLTLKAVGCEPAELGLFTLDPYVLFEDPGTEWPHTSTRAYSVMACRVRPKTSHTIGWCATD